jgi:hypothetical protein
MYTREELLDAIERYVDEFGERPSATDISAAEGYPSSYTFRNRFGSWNDALQAAGLDPNQPGAYSDEELLATLRELAADLGESPAKSDLQSRDDLPSVSTYSERFGNWNDALQAAGLDPNLRGDYSRFELLQAIDETASEVGGRPTQQDVQNHAEISKAPFRREFGSWSAAVEAAGYPRSARTPTEELVEELREFANYYGEGRTASPTKREMDDAGPYSSWLYVDRFGSWNEAVEAAGLDPHSPGEPKLPPSIDGIPIDEYDRGPVGEAIVATEITCSDGGNHIRLTFPQRMPVAGVSVIAKAAIGAVDSTGTFQWLVAVTEPEQAIDRYLPLSDLLDVIDEPIFEVFE